MLFENMHEHKSDEDLECIASHRENYIDEEGSEYLMNECNESKIKTPRKCFPVKQTQQANMLEKALERLK